MLLTLAVAQGGAHLSRAEDGPSATEAPLVATFSIVAFDSETGEWGIAVQSRVIGVGAIVPFGEAGAGAIATQALANTAWGTDGLEKLRAGESASDVVRALRESDPEAAQRQIGVVDARGRAANFTGEKCLPWAGARTGRGYTVQGNLLAGRAVIDEMARAFEQAPGELGARLIAALEAGQAAGGDRRGMQSAALLIVRAKAGYAGQSDRYRDIRVDDHEAPIAELKRIYALHKQMFPPPSEGP